MKSMSSILLLLGGIAAAPYLVALTEHFITGSPNWFPYLTVILISGVMYAVGVDVLRVVGIGLIIGTILFGIGMQYYDARLDWMRAEAPKPF